MKPINTFIVISFLGASALSAATDVVAPQKRTATLELGEKLLNRKNAAETPTALINPFTLLGTRSIETPSEDEQAAARAAMMASNRTLLAVLAEQLDPKGTFVVGGEPIILLGQKKLKVGEKLPITFEGAVYELEITAIETSRFSVRYKNEELTRPIVITKSGK